MIEQRRGGWPWLVQRLSGLFLALAMVVHFLDYHFVLGRPVTFEKVVGRLQSPGWVIFELVFLALVIYHGLNGLWGVVSDYSPRAGVRYVLGWALTLFGLATFAIGSLVLAYFV